MIEELSEDRVMVAEAVLDGILPPDSLTMEELRFIENRVYELVEERKLEKAMLEGKIVFSGVEDGRMN